MYQFVWQIFSYDFPPNYILYQYIKIHCLQVKSVQKTDKGLSVTLVTKDPEDKVAQEKLDTIHEVDCLLWAIGREPNTAGLNLSQIVNIYFSLINIIVVVIIINMIGKILLVKIIMINT